MASQVREPNQIGNFKPSSKDRGHKQSNAVAERPGMSEAHCASVVGAIPRKAFDVQGRDFGDLHVLRAIRVCTKNRSNMLVWECQCKCGSIVAVPASSLLNGRTKSCGCRNAIRDIAGHVFNKLTVIRMAGKSRYGSKWECICECGNSRIVRASNLRNGSVKSCGCTVRKASGNRTRTHGMSNSPEWRSWESMRKRCFKSNNKHFNRYGGRGITVCERWMKFENFYADMGKRPSTKHSLERLNNNGNYEPSNCKWATPVEQQNNKSSNITIEFNGATRTVTEWSRQLGVNENTLRARLAKGWPMARAVEPPLKRGKARSSPRYNPMRGKRARTVAGLNNG